MIPSAGVLPECDWAGDDFEWSEAVGDLLRGTFGLGSWRPNQKVWYLSRPSAAARRQMRCGMQGGTRPRCLSFGADSLMRACGDGPRLARRDLHSQGTEVLRTKKGVSGDVSDLLACAGSTWVMKMARMPQKGQGLPLALSSSCLTQRANRTGVCAMYDLRTKGRGRGALTRFDLRGPLFFSCRRR